MVDSRTEINNLMKDHINNYSSWLNENSEKFPHEIVSETYWRQILKGNEFALKILDRCMKQGGRASDRQWEVLQRAKRGDRSPYHPRN